MIEYLEIDLIIRLNIASKVLGKLPGNKQKPDLCGRANLLIKLAPQVRLELTTLRLTENENSSLLGIITSRHISLNY